MTKKQKLEQAQAEFDANQKQINSDIANASFQPYYLIYGEEPYLRSQNRDKLKEALTQGAGEMNLLSVKGPDADPEELISFAETLPFFATRRTIVVEDSGFFKKGCDALSDYMAKPPGSAVFVFVESEADRNRAMFKRVKEHGRVLECIRQSEAVLRRWVANRMQSEGRTIRDNAVSELLLRTGNDMLRIENERLKLAAYCEGRAEVTRKDVEKICSGYLTGMIYALTDAIADRDRKAAMEQYMKMTAMQESTGRILFQITRQFYQLVTVQEMRDRGIEPDVIAVTAGIPKNMYWKYKAWCDAFSAGELRARLKMCIAADEALKSGRTDRRIAVETLIAFAAKPRRASAHA